MEKSRRYHKVKYIFFFISLFLDIFFLLVFFLSGLSFKLSHFAAQTFSSNLSANGFYLLTLSAVLYMVHFPLNFFIEFIWEHKFQLSQQSFKGWLLEDFKKNILGFIIFLTLAEAIYIFLGRFPNFWWLWAGCFWLMVSFVLAKLTPHVIIPLFYKYSSIDNEELKKRILKLFYQCQVPLKDVYAINFFKKTKKANAFFCGVGENRRVVLSDTLLEKFSIPEIEAVVAHELGHYKHRDIVKLLVVNAAVVLIGFYMTHVFLYHALSFFGLTRLDDISFFPMIVFVFMILGLLITPFLNAYSRCLEREADRFSLQLIPNKEDFISMMEKLAMMNLAERQPNKFVELFFYDHPSVEQRIQFAQNFSLP